MVFAGEGEVTTDEDEGAGVDAGGLGIDGADGVLAVLEREGSELGDDVVSALNLLTFEGEHGTFLVEVCECGTVAVEGGVVVPHECLCHRF